MYAIVDTAAPDLFALKDEAQAHADAKNAETPGRFTVYGPTSDNAPIKIELLYALVVQLLKVGKVNPMFITVEMTNLLGEVESISARQIVNDARAWIDSHVES